MWRCGRSLSGHDDHHRAVIRWYFGRREPRLSLRFCPGWQCGGLLRTPAGSSSMMRKVPWLGHDRQSQFLGHHNVTDSAVRLAPTVLGPQTVQLGGVAATLAPRRCLATGRLRAGHVETLSPRPTLTPPEESTRCCGS
jgi:hypothetical protein